MQEPGPEPLPAIEKTKHMLIQHTHALAEHPADHLQSPSEDPEESDRFPFSSPLPVLRTPLLGGSPKLGRGEGRRTGCTLECSVAGESVFMGQAVSSSDSSSTEASWRALGRAPPGKEGPWVRTQAGEWQEGLHIQSPNQLSLL